LDNLRGKIDTEYNEDYQTPGRRYSIASDHIVPKRYKGNNAFDEPEFDTKPRARLNQNGKNERAKSGPDPFEVMQGAFGEAKKAWRRAFIVY